MSERTCRAQTKAGVSCRAPALPGYETCLSHTPELAEKVRLARMRGGSAAAKVRVLQGKRLKLDTAAALVKFTSGLMQDVLAGTVEADAARVVVYAVSVQRQLIEVASLERQVSELERLHARKGRA
jgi:hypothetical protein